MVMRLGIIKLRDDILKVYETGFLDIRWKKSWVKGSYNIT
jgi:hypothetical protein